MVQEQETAVWKQLQSKDDKKLKQAKRAQEKGVTFFRESRNYHCRGFWGCLWWHGHVLLPAVTQHTTPADLRAQTIFNSRCSTALSSEGTAGWLRGLLTFSVSFWHSLRKLIQSGEEIHEILVQPGEELVSTNPNITNLKHPSYYFGIFISHRLTGFVCNQSFFFFLLTAAIAKCWITPSCKLANKRTWFCCCWIMANTLQDRFLCVFWQAWSCFFFRKTLCSMPVKAPQCIFAYFSKIMKS